MKKICLLAVAGISLACHHPIRDYPPAPSNSGAHEATARSAPIMPETTAPRNPDPDPPASEVSPSPTVPAPRDLITVLTDLNRQLTDAYFDYDRADLTPAAMAALRQDATLALSVFAEFPQARLTVEGHTDERGSAEYNLGLGDRRASRAAAFLEQLGVPGARLRVVSYGKEAPQCTVSDESCWQRNRRAHLVLETAPA